MSNYPVGVHDSDFTDTEGEYLSPEEQEEQAAELAAREAEVNQEVA